MVEMTHFTKNGLKDENDELNRVYHLYSDSIIEFWNLSIKNIKLHSDVCVLL